MTRKKKEDALVIPPRLPAHVAREIPRADDVARFNGILEAIAEGKSYKDALEQYGLGYAGGNLWMIAGRSPELLAELKAAREGLREANLFRALVLVSQRLEDAPEEITNRDLTDIIRASKPFDQATSIKIDIVGLD